MAQEAVIIENARGETSAGEAADAAHYSDAARITIGTLYIVGGLVGGTVCILVPIVHLITTWAMPLLGIVLGVRALKRRTVFYQITGVCPSCNKPAEFNGGSIDDPKWQTCPMCGATLKFRSANS